MAFSAEDIVPDSPTNNFATMNVLDRGVGTTNTASSILTDGNLKVTSGDNRYQNIRSTISFKKGSGIFYAEFLLTQRTTYNPQIGIATTDFAISSNEVGSTPFGWMMAVGSTVNGSTYHNSVQSSSYATFATNDILQVIVDSDNQQLFFGRNGTILNSGNAIHTNLPADNHITFCILTNNDGSTSSAVANFGQDPTFGGATNLPTGAGTFTPDNGIGSFAFQPPAGALALCTANLPDFTPTVTGDVPQDYFKTVTYTGQTTGEVLNWDSNTNTGTVNVGFQPDLVWAKRRDTSSAHALVDSVRGARQTISSNASIGNYSEESGKTLLSFDSDGFTVGTDGNYTAFTASGSSIVAWCWKAGGAPSGSTSTTGSAKRINTSGTQDDTSCSALATAATNAGASNVITPTLMSINQAAGFSIVKYNGTGTSDDVNYSIPHGLSNAPDVVIVKNLDLGSQSSGITWPVLFTNIGGMPGLDGNLDKDNIIGGAEENRELNSNWGGSYPNANTFFVRRPTISSTTNRYRTMGAYNYIAYCWHSVEGYSKFGSYTGNGSPDGPFIYTGFRPAFVMVKWTSGGGQTTGSWRIMDTARNLYNPATLDLIANEAVSETTYGSDDLDILSNGFKWRSTGSFHNTSGANYIFMAFSEQPFKYSNAR